MNLLEYILYNDIMARRCHAPKPKLQIATI